MRDRGHASLSGKKTIKTVGKSAYKLMSYLNLDLMDKLVRICKLCIQGNLFLNINKNILKIRNTTKLYRTKSPQCNI